MANPVWRVLLVDDDVTELLLMRRAFRDRWPNLRVDAVRIAEQAIESLRAFEYALVVSNHRLPGASGLELLDTAAQLRPQAQRVLVTATPWHDDVRAAVQERRIFEVVEVPLDFRYFTEVAWRGLKRYGLEVAPLPREFMGGKTAEQLEAEATGGLPSGGYAPAPAGGPSPGLSGEPTMQETSGPVDLPEDRPSGTVPTVPAPGAVAADLISSPAIELGEPAGGPLGDAADATVVAAMPVVELPRAAPRPRRDPTHPDPILGRRIASTAGLPRETTDPRYPLPVADPMARPEAHRTRTDVYGLTPPRGDTHVGNRPPSSPQLAPAAALREAMRQALVTLAETIEASVGSSWGHGSRVAGLACALGGEMGLPLDQLEALEWAALLHDVGEVAVGRTVLHQAEALGDSDIAAIYSHANVGWQILRRIPAAHASLLGVRHHHERWDGRGYPDGLREEQIPLQARIIAVADVFDALATDRPYRRALPIDECVRRLLDARGTHLDGALVDTFIEKGVHLLIDWTAPPTPGPRPW